MAFSLSIRYLNKGSRALDRQIRTYQRRGQQELRRVARDVSKVYRKQILRDWRQAIPRRTGRLSRSVYAQVRGTDLDNLRIIFDFSRRGFYYPAVNAKLGGRLTSALQRSIDRRAPSIVRKEMRAAILRLRRGGQR